MILFFDTETTGFFQDRLPVDHPDQPHIVQLAAQLCDLSGEPISSFSFIVNPGIENGITIPERAAAVHGITDDKAQSLGVPLALAIEAFTHLYRRAETLCAHNIKFDKGVMEAAIARYHGKVMSLQKPLVCTMEAATPIIDLPPTDRMIAAGFNKPKPPKLEECIKHFFDEDLSGAHDAMVDVNACVRVFFHLKSVGAIA